MIINNSNSLTDCLHGSWSSQTNVYLFKDKTQKILLQQLRILSNIKRNNNIISSTNLRQIKLYISSKSTKNNLPIDKNTDETQDIQPVVTALKNNLLKATYKLVNNTLSYKEYIFIINDNLIFSSGILKNIRNQKYIGIVISSYIRITN